MPPLSVRLQTKNRLFTCGGGLFYREIMMSKYSGQSPDTGKDTDMNSDPTGSKDAHAVNSRRPARKAPVSCKSILATGGGAVLAVSVIQIIFAPENMFILFAAAAVGAAGGTVANWRALIGTR